jgi:hypothetical protein
VKHKEMAGPDHARPASRRRTFAMRPMRDTALTRPEKAKPA